MKGFYIIPASLLHEDLSSNSILLLSILNSTSVKTGYSYANNKYLSNTINKSIRTITNLLKELKDKKYITIEAGNSFKRKIYINYDFPSNM